jgi:hypothetical protein
MANTKITVTFTKDDNAFDAYTHTFNDDAVLKRIIDAHQTIYGTTDEFGVFTPTNNNQARKAMVKWAIDNWKLASKNLEQAVAAKAAAGAITDIPSTEI